MLVKERSETKLLHFPTNYDIIIPSVDTHPMATKKRNTNSQKAGIQSTADAELTKLRVRLNKKREYIAILELELFNTRVALYEFSIVYNEQITPLEDRLRLLRRKLYEVLEEQREAKGEEPPDFSEPEEPEFTYQDKTDNGWRKIGGKKHKTPSPKQEEKIRDLFRELAKRFHPDLTNDPVEKKWREEVMTKVNQAYANRDLKTLQALAEQPDRPASSIMQTREQEIAGLKAELKRLDGVIADLKARIHHLEESPAWQLKLEARLQRRSGADMLTEMGNRLKEQIADLEEHLIVLGVELDDLEPELAGD
jgi:hypothetical protein